MKLSWNRLALIVGAFVLALTVVDGLVKMQKSASAAYGFGQGPLVAADSAMALFLVGLVVGMVLGIGLFFGYLVWREKRYADQPDEIADLLDEIAADERRESLRVEDRSSDEHAETLDPWERSADWWKQADEE